MQFEMGLGAMTVAGRRMRVSRKSPKIGRGKVPMSRRRDINLDMLTDEHRKWLFTKLAELQK